MLQNRLNLSEAIRHWGTYYEDKIAISGDEILSYFELNKRVDILSNSISGSRKKIAILTDKKIPFIIALTSIIRTNNIFVLLNPTLDKEYINKVIIASDIKIILSDNKFLYLKKIFNNIVYINIQEECISSKTKEVKEVKNSIPQVEDIAGIFFSSGTTGLPKSIVRTNYSIFSEAILWMVELQLNKETTFFITRPLYYTGGFVLFYSTLFFGGELVLFDEISIKELSLYDNDSIDWTFLNPYQIADLNNLSIKNKPNYLSKNILTMGAPISAKLKISFTKKYDSNLIESWGNTEGLGTITESGDVSVKADSIGRSFFTDEMIIINENLDEIKCNSEGYFAGYTDNSFLYYEGNNKDTNKSKHNNLIISDDIGYKDTKGYFYYLNREKDIFYKNNIRIFPKQIETILFNFNIVKDCFVLYFDDNKSIYAFIELKYNVPNLELLKDDVNSYLDTNSKIDNIQLIDVIPRNSGGKVLKEKLLNIIYDNPTSP